MIKSNFMRPYEWVMGNWQGRVVLDSTSLVPGLRGNRILTLGMVIEESRECLNKCLVRTWK